MNLFNNPYFSLLRKIWFYAKPWRSSIVLFYVLSIVAQGLLSLSPYAFGRAIDVLQNFHSEKVRELVFWLLMGIGVVIFFWAFHGPARLIERHVAMKMQQAFRLRLYQQLTHLPLKWHQDHHSGNLISRINKSSVSLFRFAENQFIYIQTIIRFLTSIAFLIWISPIVGLVSLVCSILLVLILYLFDRKLIPLYEAENEVENHLGAVIFDYISNMTTVLTLRLGDLTHSNLAERMKKVWPFFRKEVVWNEVKWCVMLVLLTSMQALLLIGYHT